MNKLQQRIQRDGKVYPGGILKVDMFLNHQLDPMLTYEMAEEWYRLFGAEDVNKILTIEASGISLAIMVGYVFKCPVLYAKKSRSKNISENVWSTEVESFTHGNTNTIVVSKEYLGPEDRVLIVDDFLATGAALKGLIDLCNQAGSTVVGCGVAIEKVFQGGGNALRDQGIRVESLAKIGSMSDTDIVFAD